MVISVTGRRFSTFLLPMRIAVVLCLLALSASACGQTPAGPGLPVGALWVDFTESAPGPVGCGAGPAVLAGASIEELRAKVLAGCTRPSACTEPAGSCWQNLQEQLGYVYVAVLLTPTCNAPTRDGVAVSSSAIYFVHWIGQPTGVCNMMLALPAYRLVLVARHGLDAGAVTVELQVQTEGGATDRVDSQVTLA
jgi:hypothetical protein